MYPVTDAIAGKAIEQGLNWLGRQIDHVAHCDQNIKNLDDGVQNLRAQMETVQGRVNRALENAEEIEPHVSKWLSDASNMLSQMNQFPAADGGREGGASIFKRRRLGKEAEDKLMDVVKLSERGKFDSVGHRPPLDDIRLLKSSADCYQRFESRAAVFDEIMEALGDDNVYTIGIYGMAGIGKTTMARNVARQAKDKNSFDKIVQASISQNPDVRKVQGELADFLGLKLDQESVAGRASLLCARFKQKREEKILVILDDVWGQINIEEVGIPLNDYVKGCKVVVTSRTQGVLVGEEVGVEKECQLGVLTDAEAWYLFENKVGNTIDSHPELHSVAKEVCRECGCLPLAIVTLGAALKNKKPHQWNDTLNQLKNCRGNYIKGMTDKVYRSIELSYDFLEHSDAKACFLYCCLYKEDEDIWIEDLVCYGVGRRFLSSRDTVEAARQRVCTIVDTLKTSCLLLEGRNDNCVRMHDITRDVALSIAATDAELKLVVRSGGVQQWPRKDELECCRTFSVWDRVMELPDVLECPELRMLVVSYKCWSDFNNPQSFFKVTKKLEVLYLHRMRLSASLSSISKLVNIRVLWLYECTFENLSFLKEFKEFEMLRIYNSYNRVALTSEVGKLTQLRVLDLRGNRNIEAISAGIISKLSKLEELYLPDEFDKWGREGNASLEELNSLRYLHILWIHIPAAANAKALLLLCQPQLSSLIKFRISVGRPFNYCDLKEDSDLDTVNTRALRLEGIDLTGEPMVLRTKAETCMLVRLKGSQKLFEERQREWFLGLKFLKVESCNDETEHGFLIGKPKWNNLKIIQEVVGSSPFGKLKVLNVRDCGFKYLFSCSVVRCLSQLEMLVIDKCSNMEGIVGDDDIDEQVGFEVLVFSQLKKLKLLYLPNLKCFYANTKAKSTAQPLFNQKLFFLALEELTVEGLYDVATIWNIQSGAVAFPRLQELRIKNCDELENVIVSTACPKLQDRQGEKDVVILPKLESLELVHLPNVKSFCNFVSNVEEMEEDKNLQANAFFSHKLSFLALEELIVEGLDNVATIWNTQSGAVAFPRLQKLRIKICDELENVIVSTACPKLQDRQEGEKDMVILPKLQSLELVHLPNVKSFCSFISNEEEMEEDKNLQASAFFSHKLSFLALEELIVEGLDNVATIWNIQSGAVAFPRLQKLRITICDELENVIVSTACPKLQDRQEGEKDMVILRKLQSLELVHLPNVKSFCSFISNEEEMEEDKNLQASAFFSHKLSFLALEELIVEGLDNVAKIWNIQSGAVAFPRLRKLHIKACGELENVIVSIACPNLQDRQEGEKDMVILPKLQSLELEHLPNVKSFCSFISNEEEMEEDKNLQASAFFSHKVNLPYLDRLHLDSIPGLAKIWDVNASTDTFGKLKKSTMADCNKLANVAPSKLIESFHGLRILTVKSCIHLEEIFGSVEASNEIEEESANEIENNLLFPQLEFVKFHNLPKLRSIYSRCSTPTVLSPETRLVIEDCPILKRN